VELNRSRKEGSRQETGREPISFAVSFLEILVVVGLLPGACGSTCMPSQIEGKEMMLKGKGKSVVVLSHQFDPLNDADRKHRLLPVDTLRQKIVPSIVITDVASTSSPG
jgi:hypothetical protein